MPYLASQVYRCWFLFCTQLHFSRTTYTYHVHNKRRIRGMFVMSACTTLLHEQFTHGLHPTVEKCFVWKMMAFRGENCTTVVIPCLPTIIFSYHIINYSWLTPWRVLYIHFSGILSWLCGQTKAFLPHLNSGRTGIVDINPSTGYVKPFNQKINATHDEWCYFKTDQLVWSKWRSIGFAQCSMDAFDPHEFL